MNSVHFFNWMRPCQPFSWHLLLQAKQRSTLVSSRISFIVMLPKHSEIFLSESWITRIIQFCLVQFPSWRVVILRVAEKNMLEWKRRPRRKISTFYSSFELRPNYWKSHFQGRDHVKRRQEHLSYSHSAAVIFPRLLACLPISIRLDTHYSLARWNYKRNKPIASLIGSL